MEHIRGKKITSLSPLSFIDFNGTELAEQLFRAYLQMILVDGFFHADPHPGNVFITQHHHIALIDLGMVGYIPPEHENDLLQLLLAISEGAGNRAAEFTIRLGERKPGFDEARFTREVSDLVARHKRASVKEIDTGRVVLEITRISGQANFRLPSSFTMVAKTLLSLDQVVHILDPEFDPKESIRRHAIEILEQRLKREVTPSALLHAVVEAKNLFEKLPGRINRFLDALAQNEIKIEVDAIDEKLLLEAFHKIANRITLGLVTASLIVGAALLMRVETPFKIFGYPGLAMIFFMIAACMGIGIIISIVFYDRTPDD
jgi:predicted unusual protein kinase regulating ubiquinone biosynthesis (AarF/ABC1/UbiB family)